MFENLLISRPVMMALSACALLTLAPGAQAVDGVLEINQACAANTGCFTGDSAGFPVTITASGSYVLTGNLDTSPAASSDGIKVEADDVTIDLNGFTVAGPVVCTGTGSTVACGGGTGIGINATDHARVAVKNGNVRGFGSYGIFLGGLGAVAQAHVYNVVSASNGGGGIFASGRSIVSDSTAYQNASNGIFVRRGSVVRNCTSSANKYDGIGTDHASVVLGSVAADNGGDGIDTSTGSVVQDNNAYYNEGGGIVVGWGGVVRGNTSYDNGGDGIYAERSNLIVDNVGYQNGGAGIRVLGTCSIQRNIAHSNAAGGLDLDLGASSSCRGNTMMVNALFTVNAGVDAGGNVCNGNTTCP